MQASKPLIYILASVGGLVDAVGFLFLGHLFTAHGEAWLGAYFGQGHWSWGTPHLFAIPVFVLGIVAGHLWLAFAPGARGASFLLLIEAALLAIFAIVHFFFGSPGRDTLGYFALCLLPLLAMGIQNAPTRTIGKTTFHTTYVTGVLDTLGESLARFFIGWRKGASEGSEHLVKLSRSSRLDLLCHGRAGRQCGIVFPAIRDPGCPDLSPCIRVGGSGANSPCSSTAFHTHCMTSFSCGTIGISK